MSNLTRKIKKKLSVVEIRNLDNMCLIRATLVALASITGFFARSRFTASKRMNTLTNTAAEIIVMFVSLMTVERKTLKSVRNVIVLVDLWLVFWDTNYLPRAEMFPARWLISAPSVSKHFVLRRENGKTIGAVITLVSPVVSTWNQTTCVMQELTLPCLHINVDTFLPILKHRKETKSFSVNLGMHPN